MKKGTNNNSNMKQTKNNTKKKKEQKEEVLSGFEASASGNGQPSRLVSSSCSIACFLCQKKPEMKVIVVSETQREKKRKWVFLVVLSSAL